MLINAPPPHIYTFQNSVEGERKRGRFQKNRKNFPMICRKKASPQTLQRAGKSIFSHKGSEKLQFYRFFLVNSPKKEANPLSPLYGKDHFSHLSSICGKTSNRLSFSRNAPEKKASERPKGNVERSEAVNLLRRSAFSMPRRGEIYCFS